MPIVAVSLKMYFDPDRTYEYCRQIGEAVGELPGVADGSVEVAVLPSFLSIVDAGRALKGKPVALGAQDLCQADRGAFTGEVSGSDLRQVGCTVVEIGHAERRRLYGESNELVAEKVKAARRNRLTPLICVGEQEHCRPDQAAAYCIEQIVQATGGASAADTWIAYEPIWAIGAPNPAPTAHVVEVCSRIRESLAGTIPRMSILYGGSAGPGLLTQLGAAVDGLFLGRFAHDPAALIEVVREAGDLARPQTAEPPIQPKTKENDS